MFIKLRHSPTHIDSKHTVAHVSDFLYKERVAVADAEERGGEKLEELRGVLGVNESHLVTVTSVYGNIHRHVEIFAGQDLGGEGEGGEERE